MTPYDEDYFLRGTSTGKSNYVNYRWLPSLTIPMARSLIDFLGIRNGDTLLDVGCGPGYYVKALRSIGVSAFGYDISEWAVNNCDPDVKGYITTELHTTNRYGHIFAKDSLEHADVEQLASLLGTLSSMFQKSMLFIVPLTHVVDGGYIRPEDNADPTHQIRWPLHAWVEFVAKHVGSSDVAVMGSWHIPALKPASFSVPRSCGFIYVRRV